MEALRAIVNSRRDFQRDLRIAAIVFASTLALAAAVIFGGPSIASLFASSPSGATLKEAYVVDAFKLVTNPNLCTKCHQVGTMPVEQVQGPSLALSADRLRPDWTLKWIACPQRLLHYKTVMPQNFPANAPSNPYADSFIGSEKNFTEEQIRAVRDFLMLYPQVADWPVLKLRTAPGTTGGS